MTLLELNDISFKQGGFDLQIPNLTLHSGQLYVLQGENGSGKSTLLRILALLQQPKTGSVSFAKQTVTGNANQLQKLRQHVTLLEQNPWLFAGSVEKNLAFGLKLRGIRGSELKSKIAHALEIVGLSGFQKRRAKELSGGETRRVALARALSLQPRLLLLDEPTANLDVTQVKALEQFLATLPQQGMTVVIASHDSGQSQRLAGETIRMKNGRLINFPKARIPDPQLKAV